MAGLLWTEIAMGSLTFCFVVTLSIIALIGVSKEFVVLPCPVDTC
jgi:hypothetical protein